MGLYEIIKTGRAKEEYMIKQYKTVWTVIAHRDGDVKDIVVFSKKPTDVDVNLLYIEWLKDEIKEVWTVKMAETVYVNNNVEFTKMAKKEIGHKSTKIVK